MDILRNYKSHTLIIDPGTAFTSVGIDREILMEEVGVERWVNDTDESGDIRRDPLTNEPLKVFKKVTEKQIALIPSFVAYLQATGELAYIGQPAKELYKRQVPQSKYAIRRVMKDGTIESKKVYEDFIVAIFKKYYNLDLRKANRFHDVITAFPPGSIDSVQDNYRHYNHTATKGTVYMIDQALSAALGIRANVEHGEVYFISDMGGGTTDVAVIKAEGSVFERAIPVAGDVMTISIINHMRDNFGVYMDFLEAEQVKIECGAARPSSKLNGDTPKPVPIYGQKEYRQFTQHATSDDIYGALDKNLSDLESGYREAIREIPPGYMRAVMNNGLILTGGSSQLVGLPQRLEETIGLPITRAGNAATAGIEGLNILAKNRKLMKKLAVPEQR